MAQEKWAAVWERVRSGRHAVVIGPATPPAAPHDLRVLHVCCEASHTSGGVLDAALRKVEDLLGEPLLPSEPGRASFELGLRHRFLGDAPGQPLEALLVDACNRLAQRTSGRAVLLFEAIDAADEVTVATLIQMLKRPGWLRLPLLLTVRETPQGLVAELIYLLYRDDDTETVTAIEGEAVPHEMTAPFDWTVLPPEVLRVLRAGSVLGATFEADLVARLLNEPLGTVLEKLQWAADAGSPLADRGEGWFTVPADAVPALQRRLLPSLLTFWHSRLGEILSDGRPEAGVVGQGPPIPRSAPQTVLDDRMATLGEEAFDLPRSDLSRGDTATDPSTMPPLDHYAALFEPDRYTAPPKTVPSAQSMPDETGRTPLADTREPRFAPRQTPGRPGPSARLPGDQTHAAAHLQAAGRTEAAVEQSLAAVHQAVAQGDARRAAALVEEALKLLDTLPSSDRRALLRALLWLERGHLQWHGALQGAPVTLHEALTSLETAEAALPSEVPPEVVAQLAAAIAGICYDLGDLPALQRALTVLTDSSRRLSAAGASLLATRLFNDQAAIYIRLGDPVRATHLLSQSRQLFEGRLRTNPNDTVALEELAATNHLCARLPLHVQMRPGREAEAAAMSLEHAHAAERAYQRLGDHHHLARVWETMGRLAMQQHQLQAAQEHLSAALRLQQQLGDMTGLARSTAALADLCVLAGHPGDAVALLADSITLNLEKGSPIGLAFNRRALSALVRAMSQTHGPEAEHCRAAITEVERRLSQAEAVCGRLVLPGEAG